MTIDKDMYNLVTGASMKSGNNWGTGVLIIHPTTRQLLLAERTDTHNLASPGGKVELGESPVQGAIRETLEESNIVLNSITFYDVEMHVAPNGKNWVSFMFFSDNYDISNLKNQETEMGEFDWYDVSETLMRNLFPPTRKSVERALHLGILDNTLEYYKTLHFVDVSQFPPTHSDGCSCAYSEKERFTW